MQVSLAVTLADQTFCCSLSVQSLWCKYVSKVHFKKRIFVLSTNTMCSVHVAVNVVCVFAMLWIFITFYLRQGGHVLLGICQSVCLPVRKLTKKHQIYLHENFTNDIPYK